MSLQLYSGFGSYIDFNGGGNENDSINFNELIYFLKKANEQSIIMTQKSVGTLKGTERSINYVTDTDGFFLWPRADFPPLIEKMVTLDENNGDGVSDELKFCIISVVPDTNPSDINPSYGYCNYYVSNGKVAGLKIQTYVLTTSGSTSGASNRPVTLFYAVPFKYME